MPDDLYRMNIAPAPSGMAVELPASEWEVAFPGQRVHRGLPNKQRLAMHFTQGMCRAVARGDFEVAIIYFNRLYGIRSREACGGPP